MRQALARHKRKAQHWSLQAPVLQSTKPSSPPCSPSISLNSLMTSANLTLMAPSAPMTSPKPSIALILKSSGKEKTMMTRASPPWSHVTAPCTNMEVMRFAFSNFGPAECWVVDMVRTPAATRLAAPSLARFAGGMAPRAPLSKPPRNARTPPPLPKPVGPSVGGTAAPLPWLEGSRAGGAGTLLCDPAWEYFGKASELGESILALRLQMTTQS
mmetsp:Transcript_831/g.2444  ORF Transcript_831/g.2444 Transcript_831/m.2444 type:complete len:214 (+) Transcript_831:214-855(+)